jgi:hypothetical protein
LRACCRRACCRLAALSLPKDDLAVRIFLRAPGFFYSKCLRVRARALGRRQRSISARVVCGSLSRSSGRRTLRNLLASPL